MRLNETESVLAGRAIPVDLTHHPDENWEPDSPFSTLRSNVSHQASSFRDVLSAVPGRNKQSAASRPGGLSDGQASLFNISSRKILCASCHQVVRKSSASSAERFQIRASVSEPSSATCSPVFGCRRSRGSKGIGRRVYGVAVTLPQYPVGRNPAAFVPVKVAPRSSEAGPPSAAPPRPHKPSILDTQCSIYESCARVRKGAIPPESPYSFGNTTCPLSYLKLGDVSTTFSLVPPEKRRSSSTRSFISQQSAQLHNYHNNNNNNSNRHIQHQRWQRQQSTGYENITRGAASERRQGQQLTARHRHGPKYGHVKTVPIPVPPSRNRGRSHTSSANILREKLSNDSKASKGSKGSILSRTSNSSTSPNSSPQRRRASADAGFTDSGFSGSGRSGSTFELAAASNSGRLTPEVGLSDMGFIHPQPHGRVRRGQPNNHSHIPTAASPVDLNFGEWSSSSLQNEKGRQSLPANFGTPRSSSPDVSWLRQRRYWMPTRRARLSRSSSVDDIFGDFSTAADESDGSATAVGDVDLNDLRMINTCHRARSVENLSPKRSMFEQVWHSCENLSPTSVSKSNCTLPYVPAGREELTWTGSDSSTYEKIPAVARKSFTPAAGGVKGKHVSLLSAQSQPVSGLEKYFSRTRNFNLRREKRKAVSSDGKAPQQPPSSPIEHHHHTGKEKEKLKKYIPDFLRLGKHHKSATSGHQPSEKLNLAVTRKPSLDSNSSSDSGERVCLGGSAPFSSSPQDSLRSHQSLLAPVARPIVVPRVPARPSRGEPSSNRRGTSLKNHANATQCTDLASIQESPRHAISLVELPEVCDRRRSE